MNSGQIKIEPERKNRKLPENDRGIAALARRHNLTLIASDRHFAEVERLCWEQW